MTPDPGATERTAASMTVHPDTDVTVTPAVDPDDDAASLGIHAGAVTVAVWLTRAEAIDVARNLLAAAGVDGTLYTAHKPRPIGANRP